MRSVEEWATGCHQANHWIAWSAGHGGAEKILCIHCARAYARECVEAWREKVSMIPEEWSHVILDEEAESVVKQIHTAVTALSVETP